MTAGISTKDMAIATRTPSAAVIPKCFCGMKNELMREKNPAPVVSEVMITGPLISSMVLRIAWRLEIRFGASSW